MSDDKRKLAVAHAEGMANTIKERLLPGLAAAVEAIQGVQHTADVLKGCQNLRTQAENLTKLAADLNGSADDIEGAHKAGSAHIVIAKLNALQGVIVGLEHSAQALLRHGPRLHEAVIEAVKVEETVANEGEA